MKSRKKQTKFIHSSLSKVDSAEEARKNLRCTKLQKVQKNTVREILQINYTILLRKKDHIFFPTDLIFCAKDTRKMDENLKRNARNEDGMDTLAKSARSVMEECPVFNRTLAGT